MVRSEGKILGTVGRPEGKTNGEVLARTSQDGQNLASASGVSNLIETFAGINKTEPHTACDVRDDSIRTSDVVHGTKHAGIDPAVINNQPSLTLTPVFCERLGCKRGASPFTVATD